MFFKKRQESPQVFVPSKYDDSDLKRAITENSKQAQNDKKEVISLVENKISDITEYISKSSRQTIQDIGKIMAEEMGKRDLSLAKATEEALTDSAKRTSAEFGRVDLELNSIKSALDSLPDKFLDIEARILKQIGNIKMSSGGSDVIAVQSIMNELARKTMADSFAELEKQRQELHQKEREIKIAENNLARLKAFGEISANQLKAELDRLNESYNENLRKISSPGDDFHRASQEIKHTIDFINKCLKESPSK